MREIEIRPITLPLAGGSSAPRELPKARTHWVVERSAFFAERAAAARALRDPQVPPREAIRQHPDLLGAYFTLDSARKVAEARIGNGESRERFVALCAKRSRMRRSGVSRYPRRGCVHSPRRQHQCRGKSVSQALMDEPAELVNQLGGDPLLE